ncbi:MAG: alkaline phosphatase [Candidatus Thorarchaeota archaeon]
MECATMSLPRTPYPSLLTLAILSTVMLSMPVINVDSSNHAAITDTNGLSIILMIGDGMGLEHVKLGRWVEVGPDGNLTMDTLPYNWSVTTHSADAAITDSAASATAIATGVKTKNGMVGQSPDGSDLTTILEIAEVIGKSSGLISTTIYNHATPAGFYANISSRYDYAAITNQLVYDKDVDIVLSGGVFDSTQLAEMESRGYTIVDNRTELNAVSSGKVLGIFGNDSMPYEAARDFNTIPSLAEMTNKSIEILSQDPDGFFLMVEGGLIDWSGHDNDEVGVALETIAFDKAINVSLQYVQEHSNTILLVTADHETGGLTVISNTLSQELPSDSNIESDNRILRVERANNITTTWTGSSHTATQVPLFMFGGALSAFPEINNIDNTDIFVIMDTYFSGGTLNTGIFETTATTTPTTTTTAAPEMSSSTTEPASTPLPLPQPMDGIIILLAIGAAAVVIVALILSKKT